MEQIGLVTSLAQICMILDLILIAKLCKTDLISQDEEDHRGEVDGCHATCPEHPIVERIIKVVLFTAFYVLHIHLIHLELVSSD